MTVSQAKEAPAYARAISGGRQALDRARQLLRRTSLPLLRISLGVIFVWFGALKVADVTPVKELVGATVPWLSAGWFVPALGWFEILLGLALVVGRRLGWVCAAMVAHLAGTFLAVVMQPNAMFRDGNPLLLTMEGEFVAKNLVLITAAIVIACWPRPRGRTHHPPAGAPARPRPAGPATVPRERLGHAGAGSGA